ncbi:MAG TPA: hypothetical protein VLR52_00675 [Bacteroidales bacterium]|nr:hypothetical protein [Bacteroidales bacterium]
MTDSRRNNLSGILILFFMIFIFTFLHRDKDEPRPESSVSSYSLTGTGDSGLQSISAPATSIPDISFCRINPVNEKFVCTGFTSNREFNFNNQNSGYFNSCKLNFLPDKPAISLLFLQKIPEQGNEDDILPVI